MPDYSKSLIYMITSKDPEIKDIYIGSTTSPIKKKSKHKKTCNDPKEKEYNSYLNKFIRNHGGWDNFKFIVLKELEGCSNSRELKKIEQEYIISHNATLNKIEPSLKENENKEDDIKEDDIKDENKNNDDEEPPKKKIKSKGKGKGKGKGKEKKK